MHADDDDALGSSHCECQGPPNGCRFWLVAMRPRRGCVRSTASHTEYSVRIGHWRMGRILIAALDTVDGTGIANAISIANTAANAYEP